MCIYAQDFIVSSASLGLAHARKITKIIDVVLDMKVKKIFVEVGQSIGKNVLMVEFF